MRLPLFLASAFAGLVDPVQQANKKRRQGGGAGGGDDVDKNFHCVFLSARFRA
nr:MAG TPA: hypothetical protein [Caudoviricetes sp.]